MTDDEVKELLGAALEENGGKVTPTWQEWHKWAEVMKLSPGERMAFFHGAAHKVVYNQISRSVWTSDEIRARLDEEWKKWLLKKLGGG